MSRSARQSLTALALSVEAGAFALLCVAVIYGDFHRGLGFFVTLLLPVVLGAAAVALLLPADTSGRVVTHGALLAGCVIFAFPFVWLVSTSFKYDEEIFVYPPRWLPAVPPAVQQSPYVTTELLVDLPPEEVAWDERTWTTAWPQLATYLWDCEGDRIRRLPGAEAVQPEALRTAVLHGIVAYGSRSLPAAAWSAVPDDGIKRLEERVDDELLQTIWDAVYRAVALREPTVQNIHRDYLPLPPTTVAHVNNWQVVSGAAVLGPASADLRRERLLRYAFGGDHGDAFGLQGTFPLPIPTEEFLGFTLLLRQDRSWHALRVELEVGGRRFHSVDELYLDQYRWQEIGFKLGEIDARDERELGIWPLMPAADQDGVLTDTSHFRITLHVERSTQAAATWRKYSNHYRQAQLAAQHWWSYVTNSVYLVLLNMIGQVLSCSLVAYAFSRLRWPGRDVFFAILLATMMLPGQVTMIPVFMIFEKLGWYNTLRVLWVPSFLGSAFFIFLLRQFMKSIPNDLEDAAKIDGCSYFGIYWRIILPLVKPALAAVCIFTFMNTWNDFMGPLIYINDQRLYPLALGLFDFRAQHATDFGMLMAASTLMTLPVIALFFVAQRYFIQGVTLTGMKG